MTKIITAPRKVSLKSLPNGSSFETPSNDGMVMELWLKVAGRFCQHVETGKYETFSLDWMVYPVLK